MDTWITGFAAIAGVVGLLWSIYYIAKQTRTTGFAATRAVADQFIVGIRQVLGYLLEDPELRPYFYGGERCPEGDPRHGRVMIIAEMYADVLDAGQSSAPHLLTKDEYVVRLDYCRDMLRNSPALADLVDRYPTWWTQLSRLLKEIREAERSPAPVPAAETPPDGGAGA